MKSIFLHLKRHLRSTLLLLLPFSVLAFLLQISYVMRDAGDEFYSGLQESLGSRFVITTPFLDNAFLFDREDQIDLDVNAMNELVSALRQDERVRYVITEPILHDGYLCTFEKIDKDSTMRGIVLCGAGDPSQWNEKGRVMKRSPQPPVIGEGEWSIVRHTQDPIQRYLDCIRLGLEGKATTFAYQRNPKRFPYVPSIMEYGKGLVPHLVGVQNEIISDGILDRLDIVEGRSLLPQDDLEANAVVVAPWNAFVVDGRGYRPIQVGDRMPISINVFGKLVNTEYFTVVGLHNGNTGYSFYIGDNEYASNIDQYCYLPLSKWRYLQEKLQDYYEANDWEKQSHIGVDGTQLENTRPAFDRVTMTLPVVETRSFFDQPKVIATIQPILDRLNGMHEEKVYRCISTFETYQELAGAIDSMRGIFQVMIILGLVCTIFGLPLLLLMQLWQRKREIAILQTLGKTRAKTYRAIFLEYIFLGTASYFTALLPTVLLSRHWREYLSHSINIKQASLSATVAMEKATTLMKIYLDHSITEDMCILFFVWIGLFGLASFAMYCAQKSRSLVTLIKEGE